MVNGIARAVLGAFTVAALIVTFYFPLIGFGYSTDSNADLESRLGGLLLLLPWIGLAVLLWGVIVGVRNNLSFWLGIAGTSLIVPSAITCARFGAWGIVGSVAALSYLAIWWSLARANLPQA